MATKVTALTENTTPALEDLVYVVDDPSGTPASRKVSLANLFGAQPYPNVMTARRSSGDITTSDTSGGWADFDNGLDLAMPAAAGDRIEVRLIAYFQNQAAFVNLDVHSIVSGSPVNSWGADDAVANAIAVPGARGATSQQGNMSGHAIRTVAAGDIESGEVLLRVRYNANGSKTIDADANQSNFIFTAVNWGPG